MFVGTLNSCPYCRNSPAGYAAGQSQDFPATYGPCAQLRDVQVHGLSADHSQHTGTRAPAASGPFPAFHTPDTAYRREASPSHNDPVH